MRARYDPKFEQMKQIQIESLVNFEQSLNQMIAENNENLTAHNKDLLANPENLGYENFEDVVREVVRKKMLLCVNMSCRVRCLFDISSELDEKTAMLEQELAKMEEEKHQSRKPAKLPRGSRSLSPSERQVRPEILHHKSDE
jgi:hypothetical protein